MMVLDFETDQSNGFSHLFAEIFQHSQSDICIDNLIKCELSPDKEMVSKNIIGFSPKIFSTCSIFTENQVQYHKCILEPACTFLLINHYFLKI